MEYTTLKDGTSMPMLGYGVFQIDDDTTERCVEDALGTGYRLIDTAQAYGNERGVGAAIAKSGVARDDIFLIDKVWVSNYGEGKTYDSIKRSLDLLGLDYIDMMLLHQPYNDYYAAWRDMERAKSEGLVHEIGISNFDPVRMLDICTFAQEQPVLNQVETHVFWQQKPAHQEMEKLGVQHMSWGPFAEGMNDFFHNPVLQAIAKKHHKGVGQVALRYLLDLDVVVIPKSTKPERMAENIDVFDFSLDDEDKAQIAALDENHSICYDHTNLNTVTGLLDMIKASMQAQN